MKFRIIIFFLLIILTNFDLFAQKITADEYINIYYELAISEMKRSGIPASITLAQGMLESANGNSRLSVEAKNHFGIKCHGWKGEAVYHDDDKKGECFRKYKNAKESFIDHTDFLMNGRRYAFLFDYKETDYKSWATGLSKAGYATDPKYAQKLIELIERYELHQYDKGVTVKRKNKKTQKSSRQQTTSSGDDFASFNIDSHPVKINNKTEYITATEGDSYSSLSVELDLMPWQLPKYNDAKASDEIKAGQKIYLQPKRRKAEKGKETHKISAGETMHSISQEYAIKLSRLYSLNRLEVDTQPKVGETLNLRKKKRV